MTDSTELKRMAEAAKEACGDYIPLNDGGMTVHQLIGRIEACENTEPLCDAERTVFLAISRAERDQLKAESERLQESHEQVCTNYNQVSYASEERGKQIDQLRAEVAGFKTGYEAYERVNAELKAELAAEIQRRFDGNEIAARERDEEVRKLKAENEALRKDAERYRFICDKFGETTLPCALERILAGDLYVADGKPSIDSAIDAALGQGEQS